ncbi:unnamed protein product [Paramecium sonneborni]|uniref:Tetratricopeptide repeat protein n=1 Tax=Paramecium sonneborni TaxID=65129 RepID=A0A8S1Q8V9_9CILI|nr:unnamed protein product [Paramecium sonneborni]
MQNNNIRCPIHPENESVFFCQDESCKDKRIYCHDCQRENSHMANPYRHHPINQISLFLEESQIICQDLLQFIEESFQQILQFKSQLISSITMKYRITIQQFNNMEIQSQCQVIDALINSKNIIKTIRKNMDNPFNQILEKIQDSIRDLRLEEVTYLAQNNQQFQNLFNQSKQLFQSNQYDQALEIINQAISIMPRDVNALNLKGEILIKQNRFEDASQQFRLALIERRNVQSLNGLSECYMRLERTQEAIQLSFEVLGIDNQNQRAQTMVNQLIY